MTAGGVRKRSSLQSLTEACHDTVRPHNRPMLIRLINGKCQNLVCIQSQNRLPWELTEKDNVSSLKLTTFAKAKSVSVWLLYAFSNLPSVSWSEPWREQKRTSNVWEKNSQGVLIHLPFSVCGHSFKFSFVYSALFCLMGLRRQRKICWYIKKTDFAYRHSVQQITANHFQKKKKKKHSFMVIFKRSRTPTLL